jgi:glycosyltransferase involved in cell wall biosynthesis
MNDGKQRASVVVTNYNYARWLREAIDSALAQTWPEVEVVVVDDGSTDGSRDVIESYGQRIVPVLRPNGGQAAAINAGFERSSGDPVLILDADDVLLPTAVERAATELCDDEVAQVHWPLTVIDDESRPTGERFPAPELPGGDMRALAARYGPGALLTSPTSGNAFARRFMDEVMPIRPAELRMCADQYLIQLAPLFGGVVAIQEPLSLYRRHATSGYASAPFDRQIALGYEAIEALMAVCTDWCEHWGLDADVANWRDSSWFHCLRRVVHELDELIPPGTPFILIDDGQTGAQPTPERQVRPFPSRDGIWWGAPAGDAEAIAELEHHRATGAEYLAIMWNARWWLDHYTGFAAHLKERYRQVLDDELLVTYDLSV